MIAWTPENAARAGGRLRSLARPVAEFVAVAVCTLAFAGSALAILGSMLGRDSAGTHDFVEYWAAAHRLIHGENPYDPAALRKLELSVGFPAGAPTLIPGNPPSALLLTLPLGLVSARVGEWLWLLLLLACLAWALRLLRSSFRWPKSPLLLLGYAFAPVLSCLLAGQLAIFLLLGMAMFLRWHRSRPMLAGAALWLCLLKPHLFAPIGAVLLLWIFLTRGYRILAGTTLALIASGSATMLLDPAIWSQYRSMMREQRIDRLELPCLGTELRQLLWPHTLWVQCLPVALGCLWAMVYFWKRRERWDWPRHGSLLMLVSVLVAPYSWFMDQTVLLAALLAGAFACRSRGWIAVLALISAAIEIAAMRGASLASGFYLATAPAWLLWYLVAARRQRPGLHPG